MVQFSLKNELPLALCNVQHFLDKSSSLSGIQGCPRRGTYVAHGTDAVLRLKRLDRLGGQIAVIAGNGAAVYAEGSQFFLELDYVSPFRSVGKERREGVVA